MKVFLIGGTGFIGRNLLKELVKKHKVTLLVRSRSERKIDSSLLKKCTVIHGDILNKQLILNTCKEVDALINLVGIIREFPSKGITYSKLHDEATFNCVLAAQQGKVKKFVQMSALGTKQNGSTEYYRSKWRAEELVKSSNINYTIVRPSVVYGEGDGFISVLEKQIQKLSFVPLLKSGRMQPIPVEKVAKTIVNSLTDKKIKNKTIELVGDKTYDYKGILQMLEKKLNKKVFKVPVPTLFLKILATIFQQHPWFPFTLDMLQMMGEDNIKL